MANDKTHRVIKSRQSGLSIIELLVSMLIGLFILSGVVAVMGKSKNHYIGQEELAFIQENARFAIEELSYDIRMAGYFGCNAEAMTSNSIDVSAGDEGWHYASDGILGYEASDADLPNNIASEGVTAGTDVLVINRAQTNDNLKVNKHNPSSAQVDLDESIEYSPGKVLAIASPSCSNIGIFQMSGPSSSNPSNVVHNTGNSIVPGNCDKALGGGYDCSPECAADSECGPPTDYEFPKGSSLMEFVSHAYFVKDSDVTGLPTLYRSQLFNDSGTADIVWEEVVSGVEDFEVVYGVDTTDPADGVPDRYYSANEITVKEATAAEAWVGWDRVLSARVTLIMRSARPRSPVNTAVDLGDGYTFNDRFMRQKVSTTVRVRNRGLGG